MLKEVSHVIHALSFYIQLNEYICIKTNQVYFFYVYHVVILTFLSVPFHYTKFRYCTKQSFIRLHNELSQCPHKLLCTLSSSGQRLNRRRRFPADADSNYGRVASKVVHIYAREQVLHLMDSLRPQQTAQFQCWPFRKKSVRSIFPLIFFQEKAYTERKYIFSLMHAKNNQTLPCFLC